MVPQELQKGAFVTFRGVLFVKKHVFDNAFAMKIQKTTIKLVRKRKRASTRIEQIYLKRVALMVLSRYHKGTIKVP